MSKVLRFVVSAVLLAALAWKLDWSRVSAAFATLRLELWLGAVALLVGCQLISAWRWQMLARHQGIERSWWQLSCFYFIGGYFNLLLPTSVGGDVVRAWYLDHRPGQRLPAFISVLHDRLNGLLVLLTVALLGALLSPLELPGWLTLSVLACAGGGWLGILTLPILARVASHAPRKLQRLLTALGALPPLRLQLVPTLLSVGVQVGNVVVVWLIGLALTATIPGAFFWILVPLVSLLTLLPISVNGVGVREGATALLLAPLGVHETTAITLAILWFAATVSVSLLGGLFYHFGYYPNPALALDAEEGAGKHGPERRDSDQGRTGQFKAAA